MPYNPNANWTAATALKARAPVYYVTIEGLTTPHYATAPVKSAAVTKKLLLDAPASLKQTLSQLHGKATLQLTDIVLTDRDGEITDLLATGQASPPVPTLINNRVVLYSGYSSLAEADYAPVQVGQVSGWRISDDQRKFILALTDLKRHQNEDAFRNAEAAGVQPVNTALTSGAASGQRTVQVGSTEGISEGDALFIGPNGSNQEEKVHVAVVLSATTLIVTANLQNTYAAGDLLRWATTVIQGNPFNIIYSVLTGNFSTGGSFPLTLKRGAPTGLGIATGDVDGDEIIKQRDRFYGGGQEWRFELLRPMRGLNFLESGIYRWLGYPYTRINGKVSFRMYRPWYSDDAGAGLPQITKSDVLSWSLEKDFALHINRIVAGTDFDPGTGEAENEVVQESTGDQAATKEIAEINEQDTGFRAALGGTRHAEARLGAIERRFLDSPPQISVVLDMTMRAIEIGETIELTHPDIPDMKTGTRGLIKKRLEVVEREERFNRDQVLLVLQDANFTRPAFIGPTGALPDYDSATAAQREEIMFIADVGTPPGNFSDGTPPYEII